MSTIIKAVILLAFAAVAIFWGGPIVPDAPAKQAGAVEQRLQAVGE